MNIQPFVQLTSWFAGVPGWSATSIATMAKKTAAPPAISSQTERETLAR
jgi:hypothetical protein